MAADGLDWTYYLEFRGGGHWGEEKREKKEKNEK
jgi:hypothetical protein